MLFYYVSTPLFLIFQFDAFSLGSDNQDFIEIYVGSLDIAYATFYGRYSDVDSLENHIVYSTNNMMIIVLKTDDNTQRDGRGFSVTRYQCECAEFISRIQNSIQYVQILHVCIHAYIHVLICIYIQAHAYLCLYYT